MINYLKKHKLYDNTFIVLTNDHGYDAKGIYIYICVCL